MSFQFGLIKSVMQMLFIQINYLYLWMEVHFFVFTYILLYKEIGHVYIL